MNIDRDVPPSFGTTRVVGVNSVTATAVAATATPLTRGAAVKADEDNTGYVYVGATGITTLTGFRLAAGEQVLIETNDLANVCLLASGASQDASVYYS